MRGSMKVTTIAAAMLLAVGGFALSARAADTAVAKGSVKGKVVKADGTPAVGAEVRLTPRAERPAKGAKAKANPTAAEGKAAPAKGGRREPVAQGTTDAHGEFTLMDVPAGNYTIAARLKGAGSARQNITVQGTSAADVTLTLKERAAGKKPGKEAARGHGNGDHAKTASARAGAKTGA